MAARRLGKASASILGAVPPRPRPQPPRRPAPSPSPWRRRAAIAAFLLAALAVYAGWPGRRSTLPALDPARDTVVFLGDSITSGQGLPLEATFAHRLGVTLGVKIRNGGISGDRTDGGLRRLQEDVLAHRPKLVVLELGVNDAFGRIATATTLANLRAIVRRIRDDGAGVLLVHIDPRPLAPDAFREGYRAIAREEGTWLVEDFLGGVAPGLTTDGLHPNEEGHARLAARLEPVLREYLSR